MLIADLRNVGGGSDCGVQGIWAITSAMQIRFNIWSWSDILNFVNNVIHNCKATYHNVMFES